MTYLEREKGKTFLIYEFGVGFDNFILNIMVAIEKFGEFRPPERGNFAKQQKHFWLFWKRFPFEFILLHIKLVASSAIRKRFYFVARSLSQNAFITF